MESLFTVIRPPLESETSRVLLSAPWPGKRVLVDRSALLDSIAAEARGDEPAAAVIENLGAAGVLADESVDPKSLDLMRHWWERAWHPSLQYHLWSRKCRYYDDKDSTGERRREVLRKYRSAGPPPERISHSGAVHELRNPLDPSAGNSLGRILLSRKTTRAYERIPETQEVLSAILWHGLDGVRRTRAAAAREEDLLDDLLSYGVAFDFYVIVYAVDGLTPGVHFYNLHGHSLILLREGDLRDEMRQCMLGQAGPRTAAWTIVIVADFAQYHWRYRHERALRNLYIEAGRVAQHLIVTSTAYGLGSLPTPAIRDEQCGKLLRIVPPRQSPIYSLTMGRMREQSGARPARES
jgi:SagB-type dehydrogenase family enzyme